MKKHACLLFITVNTSKEILIYIKKTIALCNAKLLGERKNAILNQFSPNGSGNCETFFKYDFSPIKHY